MNNEGEKKKMQTSSVVPVSKELLDIVEKINEGDERISTVEACLYPTLDRLNSTCDATVMTEERLSRIEARLNAGADCPLVAEGGMEGASKRAAVEGASSGGFVSSDPNASPQQPRSTEQQQVDQSKVDLGDDAQRAGPDYSRQSSRKMFRLQKQPVREWAEIKPGKFVYLKYYKMWHAILVTGRDPANGLVRGIHYSWKSLLATREVSEDDFSVNLQNGDVREVLVPEGIRVPAGEALARGRAKVGEKQFNMFTRRSRHVVLECVLK